MKNIIISLALVIVCFPVVAEVTNRCSSDTNDTIQQAYIAYYGRPGDPGGVSYWCEKLATAGGNLDPIIEQFGTSSEFDKRYGTLSNGQLIDAIYRQMFGRDPDEIGRAFYLDKLARREMSLQTITLDVLSGSIGSDAAIIRNKTKAANYFTDQVRDSGFVYDESAVGRVSSIFFGIGFDIDDYDIAVDLIDLYAAEDDSIIFFDEVPGGLQSYIAKSDLHQKEGGASTIAKTFDRTGDGYPDLFFVTSFFAEQFGEAVSDPGRSIIAFYENDAGVLVDRTVEVFGERTVDHSVRRVLFSDINQDGFPDILFASNDEDGRSAANGDDLSTPLYLFLSTSDGRYSRSEIGYHIWTHDISVSDFDNDGIIEIVDAGYAIHSQHGTSPWQATAVYEISSDGSWIDDPLNSDQIAVFSANKHEINDYSGDGCLDLVSAAPWPDYGAFNYYKGDCEGGFSLDERFPPGTEVFTVRGLTWSNDESDFAVAEINGDWIAGLNIYWSKTFDVDNDGDLDVIYGVTGFKVAAIDRSTNYVVESNGTVYNAMYLLKNESGRFVRTANPLLGLPDDSTFYWAHIKDLNGDGYLDIVNDTESPGIDGVLFLNRGDGFFESPSLVFDHSKHYTSIIPIDYNVDGIMDYIARDWHGKWQDPPMSLHLLQGK